MRHIGFPKKWLEWAASILSYGTSSILLNGIPGKQFICNKGVHQGDPLSSLYYLFGSNLLQSAVNNLLHQGVISRAIEIHDPHFPIVQYADDTQLIMSDEKVKLAALKKVLNQFSASTGYRSILASPIWSLSMCRWRILLS
jgi:hypothetical protein